MPGKQFETQFRGTAKANTWATDTAKDYCTPPKYVDALLRVFPRIDLDPCSNGYSLVPAGMTWQLPEHDALNMEWPTSGYIYVNPPYGRDARSGTTLLHWTRKIHEAASGGAEVMALLPVAPNTRHWKAHVFRAQRICFLADTRLKFYVGGSELKKGAPMACAVPYWGRKHLGAFDAAFSEYGTVVVPHLRALLGEEVSGD